jgi:hypothetical protein
MNSPAAEYLTCFSELETSLRALLNLGPEVPAARVVDTAVNKLPFLRRDAPALRDLTNLRNFIAHGTERIGRVLPSAESVSDLQSILSKVRSSKRTLELFFKPVREFSLNDPLTEALRYMDQADFSQIAVRASSLLRILTAIDVSVWLASKIKVDLISLGDHTLGELLTEDASPNFTILPRTATIADVEQCFARAVESSYQNLFCAIITQQGRDSEKALGIITPWDLLHVPPAV